MGAHLLFTIKLKYVLRAIIKHEDIVKLGKELVSLGLSTSKGSKAKHGWNKPGTITIYQWIYRFMVYGVFGLGRMSNKKNNKVNPDDYTKEELIDAIHILEEIIKDSNVSITKEKIERIKERIEGNQKKLGSVISSNKFIKLIGIANSSFYYKSHPKKRNENLVKLVKDIFRNAEGTYGKDRILTEVYTHGEFSQVVDKKHVVGLKLIASIMKENGLICKIKKSHRRQDPKDTSNYKPNLINNEFYAEKPRQKLYTDTSFYSTPYAKQGFFYISAYIDGYDNSALAPTISESNDTKLAMNTISKIDLQPGCIIHSDHGAMYTSNEFQNYLLEQKCFQSMSAVGKSLENRPIEYFWSNLKEECLNWIPYEERTFERVQKEIINYINRYNFKRRQSCLGNLAPFMMQQSIVMYC